MGFAERMTVVDDFAARVGSTPDGLLWGKRRCASISRRRFGRRGHERLEYQNGHSSELDAGRRLHKRRVRGAECDPVTSSSRPSSAL